MMLLTRILNASLLLRRSIALMLAGMMAGFVVLVASVAIDGLESAKSDIEEKREKLGQLQAVIDLGRRMKLADETGQEVVDSGDFLTGESDAVIRSALQTRLNEAATFGRVNVLSVAQSPVIEEDSVSYIGIRAAISGSLEGVHGVIADLETSLPILFIREATLRTTNVTSNPNLSSEPELFAEILFYGAVQKRTGVGASP